jgi:hypothetical protein
LLRHDAPLVQRGQGIDKGAVSQVKYENAVAFERMKQQLRIERFSGTTENAIKTRTWIAVPVYVLAAIVRKGPGIEISCYT